MDATSSIPSASAATTQWHYSTTTSSTALCLLLRDLLPQIEEFTMNFNAKIQSVTKSNSGGVIDASYGAAANRCFGCVDMGEDMSASYSPSGSKSSLTAEYDMDITVIAKQAAMPPGLKRILDMLENAGSDRALSAVTP
jgi:hypothetical protein